MGINNYKVVFYVDEYDACPVEDFLYSLDPKMAAAVTRWLKTLERHGPEIKYFKGASSYLEDGIFELRVMFSSNITRLFYYYYDDIKGLIVVTHGFVKKSQKTPPGEIERAKHYRACFNYERSMHHGGNA